MITWGGIVQWLASASNTRNIAGSNPGDTKVVDRDEICKYLPLISLCYVKIRVHALVVFGLCSLTYTVF